MMVPNCHFFVAPWSCQTFTNEPVSICQHSFVVCFLINANSFALAFLWILFSSFFALASSSRFLFLSARSLANKLVLSYAFDADRRGLTVWTGFCASLLDRGRCFFFLRCWTCLYPDGTVESVNAFSAAFAPSSALSSMSLAAKGFLRSELRSEV